MISSTGSFHESSEVNINHIIMQNELIRLFLGVCLRVHVIGHIILQYSKNNKEDITMTYIFNGGGGGGLCATFDRQ